ncbi:Notoamide biosynthesis cluster protein M' [Paramyrothecium foliicola]|nr:Notoamide biosynthesis cluster protein M' [Paramyrothecium foliicola]
MKAQAVPATVEVVLGCFFAASIRYTIVLQHLAPKRHETPNMDSDIVDEFSKLEAGFAELKVERRPMSVQQHAISRQGSDSDHTVNDLDFNYNLSRDILPSKKYSSLQDVLSALHFGSHMANLNNFANETRIECFDQTNKDAVFRTLDSDSLDKVLDSITREDRETSTSRVPPSMDIASLETGVNESLPEALYSSSKSSDSQNGARDLPRLDPEIEPTDTAIAPTSTDPISVPEMDCKERLLVFFVPLVPQTNSSFGSQVSMQRSCVQRLFNVIGVNPEYLLNLLGRPDYWSPRTRWIRNLSDEVAAIGTQHPTRACGPCTHKADQKTDCFCQHPRWNAQAQGAPLSVYVRRQLKTKLTTYIISHKPQDTSVHALRQILRVGMGLPGNDNCLANHLQNPFEIAVLLSSLSLEASKHHVGRFRRYMWKQVNKVEDHLAGLETSDRGRLTELTKSLQIISQQANSHLLNADVALLTAREIHDIQAKLHDQLSTPAVFRQPSEDAIKYVIDSMEKQKMLFLNYKSRKDGTMSLVYNLVTQSDAANNIRLAQSMKRDSTSMSAIAALTMIFLPGTFTSTVLGAGIFSARADSEGVITTSLWWLWVALTIPLTLIVVAAWWAYKRKVERKKNTALGLMQT